MKTMDELRSELVEKLEAIYDNFAFFAYVFSACTDEQEIKDVISYIDSDNPNDEDVTRFVLDMRIKNGKHSLYQ